MIETPIAADMPEPEHDNPHTSRRELIARALATLGAAGLAGRAAASSQTAQAADVLPTGDLHDFDFFVGEWRGLNRRLKKRWVGSDDWEEFPGTVRSESRLGGVVNLDETIFPTKGWAGMTLGLFNSGRRQWSLYWISQNSGELFQPVIGGFRGHRGEFYGSDTDEGRPIKVVFRYIRHGADELRWEQAFSLDGKQWETNWTADLRRVRADT